MLSHNANLIVGGDSVKDELISVLAKKQKIKIQGNPDFFDRKYETLTIDDARALKSLAGTRPVDDGGKKIFVLTMNGITVEAQNALLKLLEEPPEYAHFFLIIPSAHLLLPTVRSRLSQIDNTIQKYSDSVAETGSRQATSLFIGMTTTKRLDAIKRLMDDISKEKKTKQDAVDLLNGLEASIHGKGLKGNIKALEAIETARKYMNDRAPSMKMLLEYVALNI